jgi:hypothetical protein
MARNMMLGRDLCAELPEVCPACLQISLIFDNVLAIGITPDASAQIPSTALVSKAAPTQPGCWLHG